MFEIETDAPLVSQVPVDKKIDKDPLNLKIKILGRIAEVYRGVDEKLVGKFERFSAKDKDKLKQVVLNLRKENPDDDYAIIAPSKDIPYEGVVEIIDVIQTLPKGMKVLETVDKGVAKENKKIFSQIVLEPLDAN